VLRHTGYDVPWWIAATAGGWLAGLTAFMAVAAPLWRARPAGIARRRDRVARRGIDGGDGRGNDRVRRPAAGPRRSEEGYAMTTAAASGAPSRLQRPEDRARLSNPA
jgi:hypothetical protein